MTPDLERYLDDTDAELVRQIRSAADASDYDTALRLTERRLVRPIDLSAPAGRLLKAELAAWLIDIGNESQRGESIRRGLSILEDDREVLIENVHPASYEYNLGNGYSSLFFIDQHQPGFRLRPSALDHVLKAKNHYWNAFRFVRSHDETLRRQLWVNLANCLRQCNRAPEAIRYYDEVLREDPSFAQANLNRAAALIQLNELSDTFTANQLFQAMKGYVAAGSTNALTQPMREYSNARSEALRQRLLQLGYDPERLAHDSSETAEEYDRHSEYRRFCIQSHLCLSEHSLYCGCVGARRDDLTIPKSTAPIGGEFVPRLEFILNRLKSEFAFARLLYYQGAVLQVPEWKIYEEELRLTELFENELIGPRAEMLRLSFRNCFGVLDKIAMGVCELFSFSDPQETLYFESFWRPRGRRLSEAQARRWERINETNNASLVALYSQATDLNPATGDWPEFKAWRNALEHRVLCVRQAATGRSDPHSVLRPNDGDVVVPAGEFRKRALFLLRLTHSAIMSFAFCVREEGAKHAGKGGSRITLDGRS